MFRYVAPLFQSVLFSIFHKLLQNHPNTNNRHIRCKNLDLLCRGNDLSCTRLSCLPLGFGHRLAVNTTRTNFSKFWACPQLSKPGSLLLVSVSNIRGGVITSGQTHMSTRLPSFTFGVCSTSCLPVVKAWVVVAVDDLRGETAPTAL